MQKLESYRANTIQEALLLCDTEDLEIAKMKAENEWRMAQQRMIAEEEARRSQEQREHQKRVEKELEKQTKAIEDALNP